MQVIASSLKNMQKQISKSCSHVIRSFMALALAIVASPATAGNLGMPADCTIGVECFVQQLPDMDPGQGTLDPFCGPASYDGHDGLDLRVISMADVARGVPVVAAIEGTVLRGRDGEPDHLVVTDADRVAVNDRECGNGIVMAGAEGIEIQYCHLKQGSLVVKPGQSLKKGDIIGEIGASGLAQFPHVHVTVRKDGEKIDPSTGRLVGAGCEPITEASTTTLWDDQTAPLLNADTRQVLALGFSGAPLVHEDLVIKGPPAQPESGDDAFVGWAWFINLHQGDTIALTITGPDGGVLVTNTLPALDRNKATYSAFIGKRGAPPPGIYSLTTTVTASDGTTLTKETTFTAN